MKSFKKLHLKRKKKVISNHSHSNTEVGNGTNGWDLGIGPISLQERGQWAKRSSVKGNKLKC